MNTPMPDTPMPDTQIAATLASLSSADVSRLRHLREQLAHSAQSAHLVDIAYRTLDTPIGSLLLAATPVGLVRVAFAIEDHEQVLRDLADAVGPRVLFDPATLDRAAHELDEYFSRRRTTFTLNLDWRLTKGFRSDVLHHLPEIAYGQTASYATVAQLAGRPKAVRAVGTACATNPLPVVVPCHRVVKSDGSMGGYLGGSGAKATLLELESAA